MRRVTAAALAFALAGCGAPANRDTGVPISSIAAFDATRFAGRWYEVARFPEPGAPGCAAAAATVDYQPRPDGGLDVARSCPATTGVARPAGPGRLAVSLGGAPAEPYWVLWVDEGYRTAVIGQPSGRAGWILDRAPAIPADRLAAAREILDWNGYDLRRLQLAPGGAAP